MIMFLRIIFQAFFGVILLGILLWVAVSLMTAESPATYTALARGGLLLVGLLGAGWGLFRRDLRVAGVGLGLVALGSRVYEPGSTSCVPGVHAPGVVPALLGRVAQLCAIPITSGLTAGQLAGFGLVFANAMLLRRRASLREALAANCLVLVAVFLLASTLGSRVGRQP